MATILYKKKVPKAQNGISLNEVGSAAGALSGILGGNKNNATVADPNVTNTIVNTAASLLGNQGGGGNTGSGTASVVNGAASLLGGSTSNGGKSGLMDTISGLAGSGKGGGGSSTALSAVGLAGKATDVAIDAITGNYKKNMNGRYNLADTGVNSQGASSLASGLATASGALSEGVGAPLLHGASEIIAGANQKKEGNAVDTQYGIKHKTYNGTGAGRVAGGAVEAVAGTLLNVFGVEGDTANLISGVLGKGVGAAVGILGDKGAAKKRVAEQNRIMNGIDTIKNDEARGDAFNQYATQMPHYDKYSNTRYAKKGGILIKPSHRGRFTEYKERTGETTEEALHSKSPHVRKMAQFAKNAKKWKHERGGIIEYKKGGAVILGGQLHKEEGMLGKGNPIFHNNQKVAETEREELLLNKEQTTQIEAFAKQYEETKDKECLLKLGTTIQHIINFQTEDASGKYKHLHG